MVSRPAVLERQRGADGMSRSGADGAAAIVPHEGKRSVELIGLSRPADRQTGERHGLLLGKFPHGHRHVPQATSADRGLPAICRSPVVPMREAFHLGSGFDFGRLLDLHLVEHLRDELIGLGEDRNVDRGKRLMVHAPAVGANAIDGTMDDRLVRGNLGLRCAEAQAKYTGEIEPIQA